MEKFLAHLQDAAPGFRCYKPGADRSDLKRDVCVQHKLASPATPEDITALCSRLGNGCDEFEALYSKHDGMVLYAAGDDAGILLYPAEDLDARNAEWREWFEEMEEGDLWDFQKHGVAFGEIVASGNYFVWWKGKVYYSDNDGGGDTPYGNSLSDFLDRIAKNPAQFLYDTGCYTRYGSEQWIPGEYVSEMR